jgi:uncharacterized protein
MSDYVDLSNCVGFEWDNHNAEKIWQKHDVVPNECEQVFFNRPVVVTDDVTHSFDEDRYFALGKTDVKRKLMVVFTIRKKHIRVISARDMTRKEKQIYAKY